MVSKAWPEICPAFSLSPILGPLGAWKPTILMPWITNEEQEIPLVHSRGYFRDELVLYGIRLLAWQHWVDKSGAGNKPANTHIPYWHWWSINNNNNNNNNYDPLLADWWGLPAFKLRLRSSPDHCLWLVAWVSCWEHDQCGSKMYFFLHFKSRLTSLHHHTARKCVVLWKCNNSPGRPDSSLYILTLKIFEDDEAPHSPVVKYF